MPAIFVWPVTDLAFVRQQHSAAGQLGIALQLCALRWLGFVPEDLAAAPTDAITALAVGAGRAAASDL